MKDSDTNSQLFEQIIGIPANATAPIPITKVVQLFRTSDPRMRSKIARLVVGRFVEFKSFMVKRLADDDPRVRANAVESLWGIKTALVRSLLRSVASDPHHRVRMNALLELYLMGEPSAAERLMEHANHRSAKFRAATAWAMGETKSSAFTGTLVTLSADTDETVRLRASAAISKIDRAESNAESKKAGQQDAASPAANPAANPGAQPSRHLK